MEFIQRIPLLLITAALLVGGVFENDIGSGSQAMLAVGFVCLGCWLCIEVQTWHRKLWSRYSAPPTSVPKEIDNTVPLEDLFTAREQRADKVEESGL